MRRRAYLLVVLAGFVAAQSARADAPPELISRFDVERIESLISPRALLGEVVTERDIDLLVAHVKASILASAAGTAPPPSDELNRRAEEIGKALRSRGTLAALVLLEALEASARQRLREIQKQQRSLPPPASAIPGSI